MVDVNTDNIKKAIDDFENDDFVSAETGLRNEVKTALAQHLQKKLGVETDFGLMPEKPEEEPTDEKSEESEE